MVLASCLKMSTESQNEAMLYAPTHPVGRTAEADADPDRWVPNSTIRPGADTACGLDVPWPDSPEPATESEGLPPPPALRPLGRFLPLPRQSALHRSLWNDHPETLQHLLSLPQAELQRKGSS